MDTQPPAPPESPMPQPSRREQRRQERERRREERWSGGGGWVGGVILVGLGLIFLGQNYNIFYLNNWWALFILIPALGSLATAWRIYQAHGEFAPPVIGPAAVGLFLVCLTASFLFELQWSGLWPLFLIAAGVALLFSGLGRKQ
jgi:hypothetical protein